MFAFNKLLQPRYNRSRFCSCCGVMWQKIAILITAYYACCDAIPNQKPQTHRYMKEYLYPSLLTKNYNIDKMNPFVYLSFSLHPFYELPFSYGGYRFPRVVLMVQVLLERVAKPNNYDTMHKCKIKMHKSISKCTNNKTEMHNSKSLVQICAF